jgi:hypothetical protein
VKEECDPTTLLADMPEVVTIWRTPIWKNLAKVYNLEAQTFNQSEFAAAATKPTTIGGKMKITVPMPGRKGVPREVEGKTKEDMCQESKKLSRWPPMMMKEIATALQLNTMKGVVKMRALSWQEHVAAGHTPFRRDCLVCQQSPAKDAHHRRGKEPPRVGVLSLDMTGRFHLGTDLNAKKGKYMLVGAFTWLGPGEVYDEFQEKDPPDVPAGAPEIDDPEAEEVEIEDADDVWGERQAEREQRAKELAEEQLKAVEAQKKDEKKESRGEDEAEEGEEEKLQRWSLHDSTRLFRPKADMTC